MSLPKNLAANRMVAVMQLFATLAFLMVLYNVNAISACTGWDYIAYRVLSRSGDDDYGALLGTSPEVRDFLESGAYILCCCRRSWTCTELSCLSDSYHPNSSCAVYPLKHRCVSMINQDECEEMKQPTLRSPASCVYVAQLGPRCRGRAYCYPKEHTS